MISHQQSWWINYDLIEAHVLALRYLRNSGESALFNLGNGQGFSVSEVIRTVEQVTGQPVPVEYVERRAGDADILVASSEKARKVLGWQPARPHLETIVRDAWQ